MKVLSESLGDWPHEFFIVVSWWDCQSEMKKRKTKHRAKWFARNITSASTKITSDGIKKNHFEEAEWKRSVGFVPFPPHFPDLIVYFLSVGFFSGTLSVAFCLLESITGTSQKFTTKPQHQLCFNQFSSSHPQIKHHETVLFFPFTLLCSYIHSSDSSMEGMAQIPRDVWSLLTS